MKPTLNYVIAECFIDTNLVQTLLCKKGINHQNSCSKVIGTMNSKFKDNFAIGIIDKDKSGPKQLDQYEEFWHSDELTVCKHHTRPHYLVLINHVMESFIITCAAQSGLDLSTHGLSSNLEELKNLTKTTNSQEDKRFTNVFKTIVKDSIDMKALQLILNYLVTNGYGATQEGLKSILVQFPF